MYIHTHAHAYLYSYIHTYVCTIHTQIHTPVCACSYTYCTYIHKINAQLCMNIHTYLQYTLTYMHGYSCSCTYVCKYTFMYTCELYDDSVSLCRRCWLSFQNGTVFGFVAPAALTVIVSHLCMHTHRMYVCTGVTSSWGVVSIFGHHVKLDICSFL